ncbi:MAG: TIGR00341 family protein [Pirellulaceae bacterium]|nr:TIGR00341 family protein [Pirellulaceae bacterium]
MPTIHLIRDGSEDEGPLRPVLDKLSGNDCQIWAVSEDVAADLAGLPEEAVVLTYLRDDWMADVVSLAAQRRWKLAALPHPKMVNTRIAFGLARRADDALSDFLDAPEPHAIDLLRCNGRPVLNSVVIGHSASLLLGSDRSLGWLQRVLRFVRESWRVHDIPPVPVDIVSGKNQTAKTAAMGIVVVPHQRNSLISGAIKEESSIQDGKLHALVVAPGSWFEMLWFLFSRIVPRGGSKILLPPFVGHIKTSQLTITSSRELPCRIDGIASTSKELEFQIQVDGLQIYPGRHLSLEVDRAGTKEIFRTQGLPKGEVRTDLISKPLPYLRHAATEDFKDLYTVLRESARTSPSFLTLMLLSALLAAFGLYADSSPVIIGAMILAPLMAPIISLAMGVSRQDRSLVGGSVKTLVNGVVLALSCAALTAVLLPLHSMTSEIRARVSPNLLDLGVAVISGIAGAYAHARQEIARSLAGVAIAVALVPPLVVAGIGLGWFDWRICLGASLLFLTNLAGILFAAAITFSILGFAPLRRARRGLILSLVIVGVISVPLAISFRHMVESQQTARSLEGCHFGAFEVRDVSVETGRGLPVIRCRLLSSQRIEPADCEAVSQAIRERLGVPVKVEFTLVHRVP